MYSGSGIFDHAVLTYNRIDEMYLPRTGDVSDVSVLLLRARRDNIEFRCPLQLSRRTPDIRTSMSS